MQLSYQDVGIIDVEVCEFDDIPVYTSTDVLMSIYPKKYKQYLCSPVSQKLIKQIGVDSRHLTHLVGQPLQQKSPDTYQLSKSCLKKLFEKNSINHLKDKINALFFVSASSVYPTATNAAMLAGEFGLQCSCLDLKSGCSGGLYSMALAASLIASGCNYVLIVIAETLSKLTPHLDIRMSLSVGDGAACILIGKKKGANFLNVNHGTEGKYAKSIFVNETFPPTNNNKHIYSFNNVNKTKEFLLKTWISSMNNALEYSKIEMSNFRYYVSHQTTLANYQQITSKLNVSDHQKVLIVDKYGNMGSPTPFIALNKIFYQLKNHDLIALHSVGGGVSWCSILLEF